MIDQPGRILAVTIFAPIVIYKSIVFKDKFLLFFGILLFIWDLYWILCKKPISNECKN